MRAVSLIRCALVAALLLLAAPASAIEIAGRVVAVADGDTLTVEDATGRRLVIRLAEIDTPEGGQPYGDPARQALSALTLGKAVRVAADDSDRYGRLIGRVRSGAVDVNAEMVRQGAAWVFRQYSRDASLLRLEADARTARRGLWALPEGERMAPWEWRSRARGEPIQPPPKPAMSGAPYAPPSPGGSGGFACGGKRYCGEMASCAEARFHHAQCGLSRLDRDGDGVPCEALCRR